MYVQYLAGKRKGVIMKEFDVKKFSEALIRVRGQETQEGFAKKLGVSSNTLLLLETGGQIPSFDILSKLCSMEFSQPCDYFRECDGGMLSHLGASLEAGDRDKLASMIERIQIKEKYERLLKQEKINDGGRYKSRYKKFV